MRKEVIEEGTRFNMLTSIRELDSSPSGSRKFLLLCDCGKETIVQLGNLKSGHTKSCGCLSAELAGERVRTHGKTKSPVHRSWSNMKDRCYREGNEHFEDYGGRGVGVHSDWVNNFENFYNYIGDPPDDRRWSIERIDVNKNYEPGNILWALPSTQNRNRRKFKNNTSGVAGVVVRERKGQVRYIAIWIELDGKERSKTFSVRNFGDKAFELACDYRQNQIQRLNLEGADYSKNHGFEGENLNAYDVMDKLGVSYAN